MSNFQMAQAQPSLPTLGRRIVWTAVALLGAFLLTFLCLTAFAAVVYFTSVAEQWIVPVVTVLSLLSLFFAARFALRRAGGRFWSGAIVGALYYLVLHLISVLLGANGFSVRTLALLLIGALTGGIGANLSKSAPDKKKKHKRKKK